MASNYEVNIKLNTRTVNKQLNNLEKRISKLNKLAAGGRASRTVLQNEKNKINLATKRLQIENRNLRTKQKQLKVDRQQLKVEQQTAVAINKQTKASEGPRVSRGVSGSPMGPSSPLNFTNQGTLLPGRGFTGGGNKGVLSGALISGAFPLLFGQGPLGAAAGFTGGLIGGKLGGQTGGFAGGLVATAALTQIQSGVTAIGELGQAMNTLNPDITKLTEKMGILGTTEQKRLQIIEQTEGKQAALNEALEMMGDKIGDQNVQELKKFGETFQELTNSTVLFFTKVQAQVAKLLNLTIGDREDRSVQQRTSQLLRQNPNAPAFRNINQQIADLEAQNRGGRGRGGVKDIQDQINALKAQKREIAESAVLEKDKDKIRSNTNKLITAGLKDLKKENELNKAIIAGKKEEFLLNQAVEDKVKSMGLLMKDINATQLERIKNDITINQGLKDQADAAQELKEKFDKIGESVEKNIVGNLTDAVMGTQTLGQAAVNVLNTLKRQLIEMQMEKIVAGIGEKGLGSAIGGFFKGIFGKRESGGPVSAGGAYLVGEKGPEILQMGSRGGNIIPNDKIEGGTTNMVTVNVDASGSSVAGNGSEADQLGQLIGGIVQQTLVKEQRPGGLLNR